MNLEWLCIGGGLHGVHIAARLIAEAGVAHDAIRILDPGAKLLSRWRLCTAATGMKYLRSPSVHHLDLDPWSLQKFAGKRKTRKRDLFTPPYERPALDLFNAHCDHLIDTFALSDIHIQDHAVQCTVHCGSIEVLTDQGHTLHAQNILLALGGGEETRWPAWAPRDHPRVCHIFERDFQWERQTTHESVAVVGGGISAAQVALRLVDEGHDVHMISRHPLRKHQFDSDPGWIGPKYMTMFKQEQRAQKRRQMILAARHRGSIPPDLFHTLKRAIRRGKITLHQSVVHTVESDATELRIDLEGHGVLCVDRLFLATGFSVQRPGGDMIDALIQTSTLPCAECGYPIVDPSLRWHPRIYVTGPLAELEIGPASRNIVGARRAAERIVHAVSTQTPFHEGAFA